MKVVLQVAIAGMASVLVGCSSVSLEEPSPPVKSADQQWEPAPQGGGYYLDDGPGKFRPTDLHNLPDAVPVVEPIAKPNTREYTVMGQTFTPQDSLEEPYRQEGRASWYGRKFHGAKTANGEIYDMYKMTAAHPTLPLPSYAKVTNLDNGREVIVRVNDRGPFLRGRIIDLSYAAALKLDYIHHGSARVRVEKYTPDMIAALKPAKSGVDAASISPTVQVMPIVSDAATVAGATIGGAFDTSVSKPLASDMLSAGATPIEVLAGPSAEKVQTLQPVLPSETVALAGPQEIIKPKVPGVATPMVMPAPAVSQASGLTPPVTGLVNSGLPKSAYYLQLGAFGLKANAQALLDKLSYVSLTSKPTTEIRESKGLFKVFLGPFEGVGLAGEASKAINEALNINPILMEGLNKP